MTFFGISQLTNMPSVCILKLGFKFAHKEVFV
jgi:hypothetical protein